MAWLKEFSRIPKVSFLDAETVRIEDVRDFSWSGESGSARWMTRTLSPPDIEKAYLVSEQFRSWGASHVFVCFTTPLDPICVSIEARRKENEPYSIMRGLFSAYEIIYQYGSARDLIGKRLERGREVDVCELILSDEERWELFSSIAREAEENAHMPQRYHTIKRNCLTEAFRHIPGAPKPPLLPRDAGPLLVSLGKAHPCDIYDRDDPPPFMGKA